MTSFARLSDQVNDIAGKIDRGEGSLGKLLTKDDIYDNAKKASDRLADARHLNDAAREARAGFGAFAEVMEGLKHNFLVKSYFKDRGYWDAPEFEMTIDRKIDSLNHLRERIESQSSEQLRH